MTEEQLETSSRVGAADDVSWFSLQFSSENQEVWEESLHCVSLLVQLYGGDGDDCLAPACLSSFQRLLLAHVQDDALRIRRTALRVVKRLVSGGRVRRSGDADLYV